MDIQGLYLSPRLERSGAIRAHCSLELLDSSDPPASAFQGAGTTGAHYCAQPLFIVLGLTLLPRLESSGTITSHCSLDFLGSSNSPTSASPVAGDYRYTPPCLANFFSFLFLVEMSSHYVAQSDLELKLKKPTGQINSVAEPTDGPTFAAAGKLCPEMESHYITQAGLKLLASSDPLASASQSAGITGTSHQALQTESHSVAQAGVQWCHHGSLQPAGVETLGSSNPPASASQSAGITGISHQPQLVCFIFLSLTACVFHEDDGWSCGCEDDLSKSMGSLVRTECRTLESITVCGEGGGTSRSGAGVQAEDYKMRMPSPTQKMP
ncbi:hypothetical protein AAY473_000765 [Plecturocebus cupreus]